MARVSAAQAMANQIEKAQELVSKKKKEYDAAIAALSDLLDKQEAFRRDELMKAIAKSNRTYDEVMAFLNTDSDEDDEE